MDNATTLSLARIAIGVGGWAAPELGLKVAMLDPTAPHSPYLMRLFAVRDIALGAITLLATPDAKPALLKLGVLVDLGDAAAAALSLRAGTMKPPTGVALASVGASAAVAGMIALAQRRR